MKKHLDRLADLMVQKRWFALVWNGGLIAILLGCIYLDVSGDSINIVTLSLDTFIIGAIAGSSLHLLFAPGLYKGLDEYERAMLRADIEKQMSMAWADFCKDHPEAGDRMNPNLKLMQ